SGLNEYGIIAFWQGIAAMCVGVALSGNNESSLTLLNSGRATYGQLYRYRIGVCVCALLLFWAIAAASTNYYGFQIVAYLCASTILLEGLIPQWWFVARDKLKKLAYFYGGIRILAFLLT